MNALVERSVAHLEPIFMKNLWFWLIQGANAIPPTPCLYAIYLAIDWSIYLFICQSICIYVYPVIYLCICMSVYLSTYLAIYLPIYLSICFSFFLLALYT